MEHGTTDATMDKGLNRVIKIDEAQIEDHLGKIVRSTVEETLNGMLDAEADRLCNAERYERSPNRVDTRAGHYKRKLHTKAGEVDLKMPKLRTLPFGEGKGDRLLFGAS
jgi:transposase-like protein